MQDSRQQKPDEAKLLESLNRDIDRLQSANKLQLQAQVVAIDMRLQQLKKIRPADKETQQVWPSKIQESYKRLFDKLNGIEPSMARAYAAQAGVKLPEVKQEVKPAVQPTVKQESKDSFATVKDELADFVQKYKELVISGESGKKKTLLDQLVTVSRKLPGITNPDDLLEQVANVRTYCSKFVEGVGKGKENTWRHEDVGTKIKTTSGLFGSKVDDARRAALLLKVGTVMDEKGKITGQETPGLNALVDIQDKVQKLRNIEAPH